MTAAQLAVPALARARAAAEHARRTRGLGDIAPEDPRVAAVEWWSGCDDPDESRAAGDAFEAQLWGAS